MSEWTERNQRDAEMFSDGYEEGMDEIKAELLEILGEAELLHPYKVIGKSETYSDYNQGWCDALMYIDSRIRGENT